MAMFEMTPEQAAEWGQKLRELAAPHVNGEEVVAAAAFRRGGAAASMIASKAQLGGVVYAGIKMFNKKKAGGLPERVLLVAHPGQALRLQPRLQGPRLQAQGGGGRLGSRRA